MTAAPGSPTDGSGLLRAALVVLFILGAPSLLVLLTRSPAASWQPASRLEVHGDTWDGNLATDGRRVYLMTREEISGFWGVLYVRSSDDGGRTWGAPVRVSADGGPSAARHALTVGPDGSVWAAWSQIGPAPSTQQLVLRRSRDRGRNWEAPTRASTREVGLVGIPALVMTPEATFVAFTDGERGTVLVQALDADGSPTGDPVGLRPTTRQLYDDSPFLDAGVAAAAVGDRAVLLMHDGLDLWRVTSAGPGRPWVEEPWYTVAAYGPPRVVAVDGRLTALATVPTSDGVVQISAETSSDGGQTWGTIATWMDSNAGLASLAVAPDLSVALWGSCDRLCRSPVIRVGDVGAANGRSVRIDGPAGRPAGALLTDDALVAAWIQDGESGRAEDRTLVVATGPRP